MRRTGAIEEVTSSRCELIETTYGVHEIRAAMQLTKTLSSWTAFGQDTVLFLISSSWCHGVQVVLPKREIGVLCSNIVNFRAI